MPPVARALEVASLVASGASTATPVPPPAAVPAPLPAGRTIEVEAPLDRIPLFVRAGAILPLLPDDVETLVARHERMAEGIVGLDDRRVLEVWPGRSGSLRTRDGLRAELRTEAGGATLELSADPARPVEVRLLGRRAEGLGVEGAAEPGGRDVESRYDPERRATVVSLPRLSGPLRLTWQE